MDGLKIKTKANGLSNKKDRNQTVFRQESDWFNLRNPFKTQPIKKIGAIDRFTTPNYHTNRLHSSSNPIEKTYIPFRFNFFSDFSFSLFRILLLSLKFNYQFFDSFYKILLFESSAINLMTWTNDRKKT